MVRDDRAKYTHFNAASRWRIWVVDEPGDVVIGVDHLSAPQPNGSWENVARLDESSHDSYHAHIPPNIDERISIGTGLSREEKIEVGFNLLSRLAVEGKIQHYDDILSEQDVWSQLPEQVLTKRAANGSTHHNVSIGGTARIIQNPFPDNPKIR
jgi:hypothetical protein